MSIWLITVFLPCILPCSDPILALMILPLTNLTLICDDMICQKRVVARGKFANPFIVLVLVRGDVTGLL